MSNQSEEAEEAYWEARGRVTNLLYFAMQGDIAEVEAVIAQGVDINATEDASSPETALYYAASSGDEKMVSLLLANGAKTGMDHPRATPGLIAMAKTFDSVVKLIDDEVKRRQIDAAVSSIVDGTPDKLKVPAPLKLGRKAGT